MSEKKNGVAAVITPGGAQMVEVINPSSDLLTLSKAEIDLQIATAKQYPRCLANFQSAAGNMVSYSQEVAETMYYKLVRRSKDGGEKLIEGPSVRFAEIIGQNWRNCRVAARVLGADDKTVVSQGVFHDLETNVAISFEIKRRITKRDGTRYDDDMIGVTGAAAAGIAFRNAVLKGIPKMFWFPLYEKAVEAAKPSEKDVATRRKAALEAFDQLGVPEAAILEVLKVKTVSKIGANELVTLRGIFNAIKEGSTTAAEAFSLGPKPIEKTTEDLTGQLKESIAQVKNRRASSGAPKSSPPKAEIPKIEDAFLTGKQQADVFNAAMQAGWKVPEELTSYIKKTYKLNSIREVRQSQFAELMKKARGEK